jgi:glycosyltransferase involved in cell wall biosynthesis
MSQASISVVLATYNGALYLEEQLRSIYSQTVPPFEVIASDDCSTDATINILESYVTSHGLRLIKNAERVGYNLNFERALRMAQGDYIAISDQDDVWYSDKLERSLQAMLSMPPQEPNLVTAVVADCGPSGKVYHVRRLNSDITSAYKMVPDTYMQGATQLMNRELLNIILPFPEKIFSQKITYDLYIASVALLLGNRYVLSQPVMKYRHHFYNAAANRHTGIFRRFLQHLWKPVSYNAIDDRYVRKYLAPVYEHFQKENVIHNEAFIQQLLRIPQRIGIILTIQEWPLLKRIQVLVCTVAVHIRTRRLRCERETVHQ